MSSVYVFLNKGNKLASLEMQYSYMFNGMAMHTTNHRMEVIIPVDFGVQTQDTLEHWLGVAMSQQVKSKEELELRRKDFEVVLEVAKHIGAGDATVDQLFEEGRLSILIQRMRILSMKDIPELAYTSK